MSDTRTLAFEPFQLDLGREQLRHGERVVQLTNKAFAVLHYLAEHATRLVTREALLEAVWPETFVSEAVLTVCIHELRQALGDSAQTPRFIETVRGRGYRFLPPVTIPTPSPARPEAAPAFHHLSPSAPPLVGREAELSRLHHSFAEARRGERQVVFITGEAGIGKTSVVDTFITHLSSEASLWIGHGQCIEQYGAGEAYLPLLEALGRLCRGVEGRHFLDLLAQQAPSWLVQMPALLSLDELDALQRRGGGATRERMLRELAEAVEMLTLQRPLVLVLEDLHWSDRSTLEWLAYAARRRDRAQLLVLGTYRPVEVIVQAHPLRAVTQELKRHGHCMEMLLDYLSEAGVAHYMAERFGANILPEGFVHILHQRTHGNPLFLVTLINDMVRQGTLAEGHEGWQLQDGLDTVAVGVPESVRQLIEYQLERVSAPEKDLLEAASVAGMEFSTAAVAAGVDAAEEEIEACCTALAQRDQFLQAKGTTAWPDGTVASRYGFVHTLHQQVLYDRVPGGRRVRLHRQIAACLEAGYGTRTREIAAELAVHFMRASDTTRAVQYLELAGENALRRSAYQEAITHLNQGLEMLTALPDSPERARHELTLQSSLGGALIAAKGYAWPETGHAFARARELYKALGLTAQDSNMLYGLCLFHLDRGEMTVAHDVAAEALHTAEREHDTTARLLAHRLVGTCLYFLGKYSVAREHLEQALGLYDPTQHRPLMFVYAADVRVAILSWLSRVLFLLGYPESAHTRSREALALAQELSHPHSVAYALRDACFLPQIQRDFMTVQERAEAVISLAIDQGFSYELAEGRIHHGWALAESGQVETGIAEMRQGLEGYLATGSEFQMPYFLALLANILTRAGQYDEGLRLLNEALARVDRTQERWFEAELYRLKGDLLRSHFGTLEEAEACVYRAKEVAQSQGARVFALRAAVSLSRMWQHQNKRTEARQLLALIYAGFTEGRHMADLTAAEALLGELSS